MALVTALAAGLVATALAFHSEDAVLPLEDMAPLSLLQQLGGRETTVGATVGKSRVIEKDYEMPSAHHDFAAASPTAASPPSAAGPEAAPLSAAEVAAATQGSGQQRAVSPAGAAIPAAPAQAAA